MEIKNLLNENGQFKDSALEQLFQLILNYCFEEKDRKNYTREQMLTSFKKVYNPGMK